MVDITENPLAGSSQGANRTTIINNVSTLPRSALKAIAQNGGAPQEFGADRSPDNTVDLGGVEVNSARSTFINPPPEIGKGSIADIFL